MATFSSSQVVDIAEVLSVDTDTLSNHLTYYDPLISAEAKTKVLSRVSDYQAIEDDVTVIEANPGNKGVAIDPSEKRSLIRQRIAVLLFAQELAGNSGGGQLDCVRG